MALSVDGRTLATGGLDGTLRHWDAETAAPRSQAIETHSDGVTCMAFSVDRRTLATGSVDGKLRLWIADFPEGEMESDSSGRKRGP